MDYSLPIPIRKHNYWKDDYQCICKFCSNVDYWLEIWDIPWDNYSSNGYNCCLLCNKKVWYCAQICSLYGKRSGLVCFYCRIPYWNKGLTNGQIHKLYYERLELFKKISKKNYLCDNISRLIYSFIDDVTF